MRIMQDWESIYRERGEGPKNSHPDMPKLVRLFRERGVKRILDLGCGSGRHLLFLAKRGFHVYGFDASPTAIRIAKTWLKDEGLNAHLKVWDMNRKLPYRNKFFDALISTQAIHHNTPRNIKAVIREIKRILRRDGVIFVTVPKGKTQAKRFRKIEERTYVPLDGTEKGIPHYYFNRESIKHYFRNFDIRDVHLDEWDHYCFVGVRKK